MYGTFFKRSPRNGDPFYVLTTSNDGNVIITLLKGIRGTKDLVCERSEVVENTNDARAITTEILHDLMSRGWIPSTDFNAGAL